MWLQYFRIHFIAPQSYEQLSRQDWQDTAGAVLHFLRFDGAHHGGAGAVVDADADG